MAPRRKLLPHRIEEETVDDAHHLFAQCTSGGVNRLHNSPAICSEVVDAVALFPESGVMCWGRRSWPLHY